MFVGVLVSTLLLLTLHCTAISYVGWWEEGWVGGREGGRKRGWEDRTDMYVRKGGWEGGYKSDM